MLNNIIQELKSGWTIESFDYNDGFVRGAYKTTYKPLDGIETEVPTTVQNALFKAGKIPDPYAEYNVSKITWIETKEWWFYNDFKTPLCKKGQRVFVRFEGITYRAEVWVNGVQAGRMEGMFKRDEFDITDYLNNDGKLNRLSVRVRTQENAIDDSFEVTDRRIRTQGPVAQNMYRWNWCPHMVCVGIWQPVKILLKSDLEVEMLRVRTLNVNLKNKNGLDTPCADAELQVDWFIKNSSDTVKEFELVYDLSGETFNGQILDGSITGKVKPGQTKVCSKKFKIKQARLWWPNGLGKAELHKFKSLLKTTSGNVQENNEVFGIRKFVWIPNEDVQWVVDTSGSTERPWSMVGKMYNWTLQVNGWKMFMKGSNWVMLDILLRLESWRYDRQLSLFKAGGLNFLRIWGGSIAETEEFYDLCDRYGIVCWQEFWLACGNYPGMNHDVFIDCVKDTVKRLINRTCLVHYSGGNEYEPDNMENKVLVDKIETAVAEIDPEREFRRGSPYKGDRHGGLVMTPFVTRNKYLDVLYGDKRITMMRSEVATARSTPMLSSFEKMMPAEKRWPIDEKMWRHFFGVPCEFIGFANEYDSADEYDHAIYANYLWHSHLSRVNMEYCRTRMYQCSGNLNWQFNVPWPCLHRAIVDTWGVPKPAYYSYINSSKPVIASVDMEKYLWNPGEVFNAGVYLVNDLYALKSVTLKLKMFSVGMELISEEEFRVDLPENKSVKLCQMNYKIPADMAKKTILIKTDLFHDGKLIHENLYWFAVSNNHEPAAKINLAGEWERKDHSKLQLPGADLNIRNDSFDHIFTPHEKHDDLEHQSNSRNNSAINSNEPAVYRKKFRLPAGMQNMNLEFFTPGFEGSDEVYVNGHKIGSHELRGMTLDTDVEAWCFIPWNKKKSSMAIDPDTEYLFYADPISLPKLDARFYDIPQKILKQSGENEIELRIWNNYKNAVSNPMEIRPCTVDREGVARYLKKGVFYSDLRHMPESKIDLKIENKRISVKNISKQLAFSVLVEIIPETTDIAVPLSDNSLSLLPGEEKVLHPMTGKSFEYPARVRVYGWNIPAQDFKIEKPE